MGRRRRRLLVPLHRGGSVLPFLLLGGVRLEGEGEGLVGVPRSVGGGGVDVLRRHLAALAGLPQTVVVVSVLEKNPVSCLFNIIVNR